MTIKRIFLDAVCCLLFISFLNTNIAQTIGPKKGSLVIVGGNARIAPNELTNFAYR